MCAAGLQAGLADSFCAQALRPIRAVPTATIARILNIVIFPLLSQQVAVPPYVMVLSCNTMLFCGKEPVKKLNLEIRNSGNGKNHSVFILISRVPDSFSF